MNFCGADYDQHFDAQDTKVSDAVLCGPCVRDEHDRLKDVFSDEDNDEDIREGRAPLDVIEETIDNTKSDDDGNDEGEEGRRGGGGAIMGRGVINLGGASVASPGRPGLSVSNSALNSPNLSMVAVAPSKGLEASPSPIYLNPMSDDDWNDPARQQKTRPDLRCPSIPSLGSGNPPSANINRLVKRLEGGFRVQYYHPGQSTKEPVLLFLDQDRNQLCLQTDEEKKEDDMNYQELPMDKILRLEIGGKSRTGHYQLNAFSIVLNQESRIVYYDFVASSPLERELIVSTLMAVIDQLEASAVDERKGSPDEDDTSLVEQRFSSIVKGIESSSSRSVAGNTRHFDDRSTRSTPPRSAAVALAEKKEKASREEKKSSSIAKGVESTKRQSPASAVERKSFSSFKDRAYQTLAEKRISSSSLKGAEEPIPNSTSGKVTFAEDRKKGSGSFSAEKKSFPPKRSPPNSLTEKKSPSKAAIQSVESRKQRIKAEKRALVPVVEAIELDESKESSYTEKKPITLVQGVADAKQSNALDDQKKGTTFHNGPSKKDRDYPHTVKSANEKHEENKVVEDSSGGHNNSKDEIESDEDFGTQDAPIPCSPSLENQLCLASEFSPRRSTKLFNDGPDEGTEASLVIHLEDVENQEGDDGYDDKKRNKMSSRTSAPESSLQSNNKTVHFRKSSTNPDSRDRTPSRSAGSIRNAKMPKERPEGDPNRNIFRQPSKDSKLSIRAASPRPTPETMHLSGSFGGGSKSNHPPGSGAIVPANGKATEDLMVEFASSSGHLASAWCADNDICTFALKDITDTCTSVFALKQAEMEQPGCTLPSDFTEQQALIEEYIANALGAPSAFYSYLTEGEKFSDELIGEQDEPKPSVNGRVRNRSGVSNGQASRMRRLRSEMTFAAALKRSKDNMQYVQTTKSFDDAKVLGSKTKASKAVEQFHSSALLQSVVGTMMMSSPEKEDDEEVAYYDSDPEDARPRTMHKRCPRQAELCKKESHSEGELPPKKTGSAFDKIKSTKRVSKKLDEETIVQIVQVCSLPNIFCHNVGIEVLIFKSYIIRQFPLLFQTMTNERMTLIWHPSQRKSFSNRAPRCVRVWIEAGVCLVDGTFVLPKLSWSKVMDKDDSDDSNAGNIGRRLLAREEPHKVDLLDICRVHATKSVDRKRHPFADARKSFFVETQSEAILFEALTGEERDRIVYGLKLVIARLASLLMLRDVRAAEEFFGAVAPPVPGEAPEWIQGNKSTTSSQQGGLLPPMRK